MKRLSVKQWVALGVTLVSVGLASAFGLFTRLSFTEEIQNIRTNDECVVMFPTSYIPEANFDLLWSSDLIVKAVAEDYGTVAMECTKTQLKITEVYKGSLKIWDEFILLQNNEFTYAGIGRNEPTIRTKSVSNVILPDKEYIIFANKKESSELYYKYAEKYSFASEYVSPISKLYTYEDIVNSALCYYFMCEETKVGFVSDGFDGEYTKYSQVADCEILCKNEELAEQYKILKENVMQKLKNELK